ncbi:MAG: hypothetical protein KDB79_04855 [Acidobacteria bacterium]|nr:hypothetical protein [Acidobacteriota bacterium]
MAKWTETVRSSGGLDVYNNIRGRWAGIFQTGLQDVNELFRQNGIRIQFREVNDQNSANIVIASANGTTEFRNGNQLFRIDVDGTRLHGHTRKIGDNNTIQKAYIFLPENPLLSTPRERRPTGNLVMRAIQVHEYIHSVGLSDSDHSGNDIFIGSPDNLPGREPNSDRLGVRYRGELVWFPPFIINGPTIAKIRSAWS